MWKIIHQKFTLESVFQEFACLKRKSSQHKYLEKTGRMLSMFIVAGELKVLCSAGGAQPEFSNVLGFIFKPQPLLHLAHICFLSSNISFHTYSPHFLQIVHTLLVPFPMVMVYPVADCVCRVRFCRSISSWCSCCRLLI